MRLFTADFVHRWHGRMLNIHPSLLPLFRGTHTHVQALAAGVLKESERTVLVGTATGLKSLSHVRDPLAKNAT